MTPRRVSREPRFDRKIADCGSHFGNFFTVGYAVTTRRQATEQANKPRAKHCDTNYGANGHRPLRYKILPQEGQHQKVGPENQLQVVPLPRRALKKISEKKHRRPGTGEGERSINRNALISVMEKYVDRW